MGQWMWFSHKCAALHPFSPDSAVLLFLSPHIPASLEHTHSSFPTVLPHNESYQSLLFFVFLFFYLPHYTLIKTGHNTGKLQPIMTFQTFNKSRKKSFTSYLLRFPQHLDCVLHVCGNPAYVHTGYTHTHMLVHMVKQRSA